jgi:hypothetical protein
MHKAWCDIPLLGCNAQTHRTETFAAACRNSYQAADSSGMKRPMYRVQRPTTELANPIIPIFWTEFIDFGGKPELAPGMAN